MSVPYLRMFPTVAVGDLVAAHGFDHEPALLEDILRHDADDARGPVMLGAAQDVARLRFLLVASASQRQFIEGVDDPLDEFPFPRLVVLGRGKRPDGLWRPARALVSDLAGRTDARDAKVAFALALKGGGGRGERH